MGVTSSSSSNKRTAFCEFKVILNGFIRTQDLTTRVTTQRLTGQHIEVIQVNKTITDKYTKGLRDNYTLTSSYAIGYYK